MIFRLIEKHDKLVEAINNPDFDKDEKNQLLKSIEKGNLMKSQLTKTKSRTKLSEYDSSEKKKDDSASNYVSKSKGRESIKLLNQFTASMHSTVSEFSHNNTSTDFWQTLKSRKANEDTPKLGEGRAMSNSNLNSKKGSSKFINCHSYVITSMVDTNKRDKDETSHSKLKIDHP